MSAADTLAAARALGVVLSGAGGELRYEAPAGALSPELRAALVEHKAALLAALAGEADAEATARDADADAAQRRRAPGPAEYFDFAPPGDPANDDEALAERVAIMVEGNGWDEATALREARWAADRERCWRVFLRNAARVLAAPAPEHAALLARYRAEAATRYGADTAQRMAQGLALWVSARTKEA